MLCAVVEGIIAHLDAGNYRGKKMIGRPLLIARSCTIPVDILRIPCKAMCLSFRFLSIAYKPKDFAHLKARYYTLDTLKSKNQYIPFQFYRWYPSIDHYVSPIITYK